MGIKLTQRDIRKVKESLFNGDVIGRQCEVYGNSSIDVFKTTYQGINVFITRERKWFFFSKWTAKITEGYELQLLYSLGIKK